MRKHGEVFESHLLEKFQISVDVDENGWESVVLYHEEIEEGLIPENYLEKLMDPMLFHMTTYEDEQENEWLFALATAPNDINKLLYAICLNNDVKFTSWVP